MATLGADTFQIEAKNRQANTNERTGLVNTLGKARKQLPKGANGIVYIAIPQTWIVSPEKERIVEEQVTKFLNTTSRVKHVVLEWVEWFDFSHGRVALLPFKTYPTSKSLNLQTIGQSSKEDFDFSIPSFWSVTA